MKRVKLIAAAVVAVLLLAAPAAAGPRYYHDPLQDRQLEDGRGFPPLVDLVLTRPFGLGCVAGGTVLFVVLSPFSAIGDLGRPGIPYLKASSRLVADPVRFTFLDRLGSH